MSQSPDRLIVFVCGFSGSLAVEVIRAFDLLDGPGGLRKYVQNRDLSLRRLASATLLFLVASCGGALAVVCDARNLVAAVVIGAGFHLVGRGLWRMFRKQ